MLFLVATPIGNLKDITFRAIETLGLVSYILCEDTRKSRILLKAHGIDKPLVSFHKFSERKQEEKVIADLRGGADIALISDAGTPGINDPGQLLVDRCHKEGLDVTSLPGASAPIVALSLCGLNASKFQYLGFVPKKGNERKLALIDSLFYPGLSVFFESPQRIEKTLKELVIYGPKHHLALARELTKMHETLLRGTASELLEADIRGEIVLIIEGHAKWESSLSPNKVVEDLQKQFDLTGPQALSLAAKLLGIPKKELYSSLID